jgi:hypothetical protein
MGSDGFVIMGFLVDSIGTNWVRGAPGIYRCVGAIQIRRSIAFSPGLRDSTGAPNFRDSERGDFGVKSFGFYAGKFLKILVTEKDLFSLAAWRG